MRDTQITRRNVLRGLGLTGAVLAIPELVSACGSGSGGGSDKLTFWWNPSVESADQMNKWMKGVISTFEKANSGVTVDSVDQPAEQLVSNFRTACQSHTGPGLDHQYSGPYTMQFVWENCVAPMDGLVPKSEFAHIDPASLKIYQFEGKTYAMPWYDAPVCIMYNKALFKKAGLDPDSPPTTKDDFLAAADKLRGAGITPWTYGVKNLTGIGNFAGMFATQQLDQATELLDVVLGNKSYTDPRYSGWIGWIQEMIDAKVFNSDVTSLEYQDAMNAFLARKCGMAITSSLLEFRKELGDDLGVMAPPVFGSGALAGKVHFNPHPLFITSFANNKKLAAKFLEQLHTAPTLNAMYQATGFFPADDRFDPAVLSSPQDKTLYDLVQHGTIGYQNYWPSEMDRENIFLGVQAAFSGTKPDAIAGQIEKRLGGWRKSAGPEVDDFRKWSQSS